MDTGTLVAVVIVVLAVCFTAICISFINHGGMGR